MSNRKAVALLLVALAAVLPACSNDDGATSKTPRATTTTAPLDVPFGIGRVAETFVDSSRPTPRRGRSRAATGSHDRHLDPLPGRW